MTHEIGLVGLGERVEMIAHLLHRADRKAVVWPGPRGNLSAAKAKNARNQLLGQGAEIVDTAAEMARRARLVMVVSSHVDLRELALELGNHLQGFHRVVHTRHGLEEGTGLRGSQTLLEETSCRQVGALVGPLYSTAQLEEKPGASVVGSRFPAVIHDVQEALSSPLFRVYGNADLVGVEISSAMADMVAVAVGVGDALDLGPSIRGTLMARGVAEMGRVASSSGGVEKTCAGMSGLGYLVAETSGEGRFAYQAGRAMAGGKKGKALEKMFGGFIGELTHSSGSIVKQAEAAGVDAHITVQVHKMLTGESSTAEALRALLTLSQMME
jgi:glycerol-3-phosphate dehydrogenase (NAD(P)+)